MSNSIVDEWLQFAKMDYDTARYLYETMRPKPLEIICYHCQQAVEKYIKGILLAHGVSTQKTHDLGMLAEQLQAFTEVPEEILDICDNLTPYGVKIWYPQELFIQEHHAQKAVEQMVLFRKWVTDTLVL